MSSFTEARFEPVPGKFRRGRQAHRTAAAFSFYIGHPGTGCCITVPAGFETDFASIPALVSRFLPGPLRRWVEARLSKSAALHDRLREDLQFNLIDCDALMLVAMKADGTPWLLREIAFVAVRTNRSRIPHNA